MLRWAGDREVKSKAKKSLLEGELRRGFDTSGVYLFPNFPPQERTCSTSAGGWGGTFIC